MLATERSTKSSPKRERDTTPANGQSRGGSRPDRHLVVHGAKMGVEQADDYEREIRAAMQLAADHPYLGSPFALGLRPYRKRLVGPHKLIYRATTKTVVIVRIIHGARDEAR